MDHSDYLTLNKSLSLFETGLAKHLTQGVYYGTRNLSSHIVLIPSLTTDHPPMSTDELDNMVWTEWPNSTVDDTDSWRVTRHYLGDLYTIFVSSQTQPLGINRAILKATNYDHWRGDVLIVRHSHAPGQFFEPVRPIDKWRFEMVLKRCVGLSVAASPFADGEWKKGRWRKTSCQRQLVSIV